MSRPHPSSSGSSSSTSEGDRDSSDMRPRIPRLPLPAALSFPEEDVPAIVLHLFSSFRSSAQYIPGPNELDDTGRTHGRPARCPTTAAECVFGTETISSSLTRSV